MFKTKGHHHYKHNSQNVEVRFLLLPGSFDKNNKEKGDN